MSQNGRGLSLGHFKSSSVHPPFAQCAHVTYVPNCIQHASGVVDVVRREEKVKRVRKRLLRVAQFPYRHATRPGEPLGADESNELQRDFWPLNGSNMRNGNKPVRK